MVGQKEVASSEASAAESELEVATKQLTDSDTNTQLGVAEKQLKQLESTLYTIREYVESRRSESDYKPMLADVVTLIADINKFLCEAAATPSGSALQ
jgi:hypothetical protein